jgi:hypothetical protein
MSKSSKQLPQLSENSWGKHRFNRSNGVLYHLRAYNIIPFLSVALHKSGIRKYIFRSVTVYSKKKYSSSQWKLIVQIEPVQDKIFSKSKTWNYSRTYQLWILIRIRVPTKPLGFFYFVRKDKWHSLISPYVAMDFNSIHTFKMFSFKRILLMVRCTRYNIIW